MTSAVLTLDQVANDGATIKVIPVSQRRPVAPALLVRHRWSISSGSDPIWVCREGPHDGERCGGCGEFIHPEEITRLTKDRGIAVRVELLDAIAAGVFDVALFRPCRHCGAARDENGLECGGRCHLLGPAPARAADSYTTLRAFIAMLATGGFGLDARQFIVQGLLDEGLRLSPVQ